MENVVPVTARRCAWCDRVFTAGGWTTVDHPREQGDETVTICPDCAATYPRSS